MFLFSMDYFLHYLKLPGGLTAYTASFFIQFFYYRWLGIIIYAGIFFLLYATFKQMLEKFSVFKKSFFVAFIPGLLFLPASICLFFDIADELAVIIAISGFIVLTKLAQSRFYYFWIPSTVTVLYVLVGGNVLLSLTLFVLYLFFGQRKNKFRQIATGILSLSIPVVIWYLFYMVSFRDASIALSPFRYPDAKLYDFRTIAWLSVGIVPFTGLLLKNIKTEEKWVILRDIALAMILFAVVVKFYRHNTENIVKMGFDAESQQWDNIIDAHHKTDIAPLNCFYTNLALQKTGQMAEKMFHYEQIGISGLFLDQEDYFSCQAKSELFFRLGLINIAQQNAYESMMGYSTIKEPNIRNMKRLLCCAMIRQDEALTAKYEKILNKTLFYRDYPQKLNTGSNGQSAITMKNILIGEMSLLLETILEDHPENQMAFEYLMAYYLLERNFERAKNCYDRYFSNFSYPKIPAHYAEFLLLYKHFNQLDDSFYKRYPVSNDIRERFEMMDILVSAKMTKQIQKTLNEGFKDTYWFYVRFPLVQIKTTQKNEKNIY